VHLGFPNADGQVACVSPLQSACKLNYSYSRDSKDPVIRPSKAATGGNLFTRWTVLLLVNDLSVQNLDSRLTALFQPDELAGDEYRKTVQRSTPLEPERRLMLAVLDDAIFCFQKYLHPKSSKERSLYQEAAAWIFDRNDARTFSFENICDLCGLAPNYLRRGLLHWREQMNSINDSQRRTPVTARNTMRAVAMRGRRPKKRKRGQRVG
jgi:hypothetical protein